MCAGLGHGTAPRIANLFQLDLIQYTTHGHRLRTTDPSLHLAKHLLSESHVPPKTHSALLNSSTLSQARILELGSGTGLLAILLNSLCKSYTASDQFDNLKLIQRNLEINGVAVPQHTRRDGDYKGAAGGGEAEIEEVDWVAISHERARRGTSASKKAPTEELNGREGDYDLILAVDCIYNESLVVPLVDTFAEYAGRGKPTLVWVVIELRSSDVVSAGSLRGQLCPVRPMPTLCIACAANSRFASTRSTSHRPPSGA
jgi:hypothetical protein